MRRAAGYLLGSSTAKATGGRDLTADTTLESDFILLELWLASAASTGCGTRRRAPLIDKAVRSILARQLPDGGFNIYVARPVRDQRHDQGLHRAEAGRPGSRRSAIWRAARAHSGAGRLAGGQQLRQDQPQPVRAVSARAHARRFRRSDAAGEADLRDVLLDARHRDSAVHRARARIRSGRCRRDSRWKSCSLPACRSSFANNEGFFSWRNFFLQADKFVKLWERHGSAQSAPAAIRRAEQWVLEHTRYSGGLGAIYPSMMYVDHGARSAGISRGSSGSRGSRATSS